MKIFFRFKISLLIILLSFGQIFADYSKIPESVKTKLEASHKQLSIKLSSKYTLQDQSIFLEKLSTKLKLLEKNTRYKKYSDFISYVIYLNDTEIKYINNKIAFYETKKLKENFFESNKGIIDKYSFSKSFTNVSYNPESIFLENWIRYYFNYVNFIYFDKNETSNLSLSDLKNSKIDINKDLLVYDKRYGMAFVKDYKKVRLIDDKIISDIGNKYKFLSILKNDKLDIIDKNYDSDFIDLRQYSISLTSDLKTQDEKIEKIYNYILNNISYTKNINLTNPYISSWIETYKNKDWICSWYAKLFLYMLYFSWIWEFEYIPWFVLDSSDFPDVWHAWVKIWNYYYDPTFDDPIWNKWNITKKDYKYFKLDYDLFYTNRYDIKDFPEQFRNLSLDERKKIVKDKLYNLALKNTDKYSDKLLLKAYIFKIKNNIWNKALEIEDIKNKVTYYEVYSDNSIILNWSKKYISFINYYKVNNSLLEAVISQLNYNLDNVYLLNWDLGNWNREYRLAYEMRL